MKEKDDATSVEETVSEFDMNENPTTGVAASTVGSCKNENADCCCSPSFKKVNEDDAGSFAIDDSTSMPPNIESAFVAGTGGCGSGLLSSPKKLNILCGWTLRGLGTPNSQTKIPPIHALNTH